MKPHKKRHNRKMVIKRHGALNLEEIPGEVYDAAIAQEPPAWPEEHLDTRKMAGMAHAGETFVPSGDPMGWVK
jgi:hypothetical protein